MCCIAHFAIQFYKCSAIWSVFDFNREIKCAIPQTGVTGRIKNYDKTIPSGKHRENRAR